MKKMFDKNTTKEKCAMLLLSCMNWGCSNVYGSEKEIENKIKKKLKFQYECDILRFRSCIDLIEDTESAIISFSSFGIEKYSKRICMDFGEKYIRLYGTLNAIYLQLNAIIELYEICKIPDKKDITSELRNHKIFELRNIMGAHTANFEDKSDYMPENFNRNSFRITQMQLKPKGDDLHAVDSFGNVREYNLYELVMSYNNLSEKILYDGCIDYMNRIFTNSIHKIKYHLSHYELLEFKNYNYRKLYKNDKLLKKHLKAFNKKIDSENVSKDYDIDSFIETKELFGKTVYIFKE